MTTIPILATGDGERLDCGHYVGCLARWCAANKQQPRGGNGGPKPLLAHCPSDCAAFAKPDRRAERERYMRAQPGGVE